jgi:hypothetical protein
MDEDPYIDERFQIDDRFKEEEVDEESVSSFQY